MHSVSEEYKVKSTYNGWSNRETWVVNLWLTNDMESYEFLQSICRKHCETWEKAEEIEVHFQDQLEDIYEVSSFWSDILGTSSVELTGIELSRRM